MEKGTTVADGRSGDIVGTRLASERDEDGKQRVIQLVTPVRRHAVLTRMRGASGVISTADPLSLNNVPAELFSGMVELGDRDSLVAAANFTAVPATADLTPIAVMIESTGADAAEKNMVSGDTDGLSYYVYFTSYPGAITEYGAITISPDVRFGEYLDGSTWKNYKFTGAFRGIDIPQGAAVASARFRLYTIVSIGGSYPANAKFWAFSAAEIAEPGFRPDWNSQTYWEALQALCDATDGVTADLTSWTNSAYKSVDIAAAVQRVVNLPDWDRGNDIYVVAGNSSYGIGGGVARASLSTVPRLTLTHDGGLQQYQILPTKQVGLSLGFTDPGFYPYRGPVVEWEAKGAYKIGIHVTALGTDSEIHSIYGGAI